MNCIITGAFSHTGGFIARELLSRGFKVKTLTNHLRPEDPLSSIVESFPLNFTDIPKLIENIRGTEVLFNTYWVRFPHGDISYDSAVYNTRILLDAAKRAGIKKVIHISVTNPEKGTALPYYNGKLQTEAVVSSSGLQFSIIRPSLIYGPREILLHNIAWLLNNFPVFVIPGSGEYLLQPVSGEDVARLAVNSAKDNSNETLDAVGPEVITYNDLIKMMALTLGKNPQIIHAHPKVAVLAASAVGIFVKDTIITENEVRGLMANLLVSDKPPLGTDSFSGWISGNGHMLGTKYTSEMKRHFL